MKPDILPLGNYGSRICPRGYVPLGNAHTGYLRCESQDYVDRTGPVGLIAAPALLLGAPLAAGTAIESGAVGYVSTVAKHYVPDTIDEIRSGLSEIKNPELTSKALANGTVRGALPILALADLVKDKVKDKVSAALQWLTHAGGRTQ